MFLFMEVLGFCPQLILDISRPTLPFVDHKQSFSLQCRTALLCTQQWLGIKSTLWKSALFPEVLSRAFMQTE